MNPVYVFGFKLAELTQQNDSACVGLLCLAIKDAGKESKAMGYDDFEGVFRTQLPARLEKMKITDSKKISNELMKFLAEKQALFTMMAN